MGFTLIKERIIFCVVLNKKIPAETIPILICNSVSLCINYIIFLTSSILENFFYRFYLFQFIHFIHLRFSLPYCDQQMIKEYYQESKEIFEYPIEAFIYTPILLHILKQRNNLVNQIFDTLVLIVNVNYGKKLNLCCMYCKRSFYIQRHIAFYCTC